MQYLWVIMRREICNSPTPRGALRGGWAQKSPRMAGWRNGHFGCVVAMTSLWRLRCTDRSLLATHRLATGCRPILESARRSFF